MNFKPVISVSLFAALSTSMFGCNSTQSTLPDASLNQNVEAQSSSLNQDDVIPGEYIVKFKKSSSNTNSVLNGIGAKVKNNIGDKNSGLKLVQFSQRSASATKSAIEKLENSSAVEYVEANRFWRVPNFIDRIIDKITGGNRAKNSPDPMAKDQWALKNTNAREAWASVSSVSGKTSTIAVLDTGIDYGHPDLKSRAVKGFDATGGNSPGTDGHGHGTHCAGSAAATVNNGIGVAGISNNSKLMSVKVMNPNGSGSTSDIINGVMFAANNETVDVLSMSIGSRRFSQAYNEVIQLAVKNGKFIAAASGNHGSSATAYPAGYDGVYAVGATDINNNIASFSAFGKHLSISAPGVNILSTFPTDGNRFKDYGSISGTSMATPAVAGLAGLLKSLKPSVTANQMKSIISSTATDAGPKGRDDKFGNGIINVEAAVKKLLGR